MKKIFFLLGRSLTTVFNVIFTYLILGQKTTTRAILCCVTIIFGFWLGIDQENESGSLSISGKIYLFFNGRKLKKVQAKKLVKSNIQKKFSVKLLLWQF